MSFKLLPAAFLTALSCLAQTPTGRWDGTIVIGAQKFPFTMQFEASGNAVSGSFVNGETRVASTSGSFEGGVLRLSFDRAATRMEATLSNGSLSGSYGSEKQGTHSFTASPYCTCGFEGEAGPDIAGVWRISDAEWRITIRRKGEDTFAAISRPGAEIGPLIGRFDGIAFTLRYFDGTRAAVLEIEQNQDSGLDLTWKEPSEGAKKYKAVRVP